MAHAMGGGRGHPAAGGPALDEDLADGESRAVLAYREEGRWEVGLLPDRLCADLDGLISVLRQQPGEGGSLALVNVADEFFVVVRHAGPAPRLLLSDVTAAAAWDLARQVADALGVPVPADDEMEDVWPAGDLSILADLGMDEFSLGTVLADVDAYADEQLAVITRSLGFEAAYQRAVDAAIG